MQENSPPLRKILIVDDQSFNIEALLIMLKHIFKIDTDAICRRAYNGIEACAAIVDDIDENIEMGNPNHSSFALIFMDCNMPMMDGFEATPIIRQYLHDQNMSQPIISACTGQNDQIVMDKALDCGMNIVLTKPVDQDLLKGLLT